MGDGKHYIQIRLETSEPIELGDFIAAFSSIGSEYARHIKKHFPDLGDDAKIYVSDVRHGSIIADLVPVLMPFLQATNYALTIDKFVQRVGEIIRAYQTSNAKPTDITKGEIKDVMAGIVAIANDRNGRGDIRSITIENGKTEVRASVQFDTQQARTAVENMRDHIRLIEHHEDESRMMVLMRFFQSNLKDSELQRRSGEQVIIQSIDIHPRPLVYASEMAKDRIKHEIMESEGNIYKKGFYVDVIIDMVGERVAAYKVTNFHQVVDLPD
jgi:hypothetical protein